MTEHESVPGRGWRFWAIFFSITVATFTTALDTTAVSTALPTITNDLHGSQFIWIGSAYTMSSTAFLPMSGGLAQVFGRRPTMLGSMVFFLVGSALCGAATSMNFLIAGRTVQGVGAGGITALTQIILSDLVPLRTRGTFNGLIGIAWSVASCSGPVIGGAFAENGKWRWLFYLNLFVTGLAGVLVLTFLKLKTPSGTIGQKLSKMDWIGNALVIPASTSLMIALTWGGVQYPWSSPRVLVPLVLGIVGLGVFLLYEAMLAKHPIVPFSLMSTRTGLSGYVQAFILALCLTGVVYYFPIYFQACKSAGPIASGVDSLGFTSCALLSIIGGVSVAATKRYRPQIWLGWAIVLVSFGLMSTLKDDTNLGKSIGYVILVGAGIGLVITTTYFPVLAPLPVSANAYALALYAFARSFGQVWGVTIGGTVLQNQLLKHLPEGFSSQFPQGAQIAYSIIPIIGKLPPSLSGEVRAAFATSLKVVWEVMIGIGGLGILASLLMKHLPLHTYTDDEWGVDSTSDATAQAKAVDSQESEPKMEKNTESGEVQVLDEGTSADVETGEVTADGAAASAVVETA
ncbi:Efflux pump FUS6 [Sparassis crispa]|uniref:Efflux pump FUS6 n=1 Tax=Sparassis crispa TaxID=139825 RepID=A0A401G5G1_9APHY|nr:Efflux pump FUS6 [Sparassis crispa]GBE77394.1 Efflux pump FUS6 [Sparassis crispa]